MKAGGPDIFLVAGEESGDALGAALIRALREQTGGSVRFRGIAGERMQAEGMASLFPMHDLTAIGFGEVFGKLPTLIRRLGEAADAIVARPPDILVLIDAPDFTHRLARRVRRRLPDLLIVKYVAPTVWAWRPGRARAMRGSIDHVLALFPFEPEVMRRLGGPPTTYVGHPLLSEVPRLRPNAEERARRDRSPPPVLILPGSRRRELASLGPAFGAAVGLLAARAGPIEPILPTLDRLEPAVREMTASWPVRPKIVTGEAAKLAAFRIGRAALAASGTVTLELALAHVPFVGGYRVPGWEAWIARRVLVTPIVILANIVLGREVVPELLQEDCRPDRLAAALAALLSDGPARHAQLEAFAEIDGIMGVDDAPPAMRAAAAVLSVFAARRAATSALPAQERG